MISFDTITTFSPQHAFLISGSEYDGQLLFDEGKKKNMFVEYYVQSMLTMEHALFVRSFNTEDTEGDRWIIVSFTFFHIDAVQVLLKTLEEPRPHTYFIFVTPYPYLVPDTIRSRVLLIHNEITTSSDYQSFLKKSLADKFAYVKERFATDDEDSAAERKQLALILLDIYEQNISNVSLKKKESLEIIYTAKKMMLKAQLPPKQVLEYVLTMLE